MRIAQSPALVLVLMVVLIAQGSLQAQSYWQRTERPGSTSTPAMVYDSGRNRLVVVQPTSKGMELFEWDGSKWSRPSTNQSPPPRHEATWTYDPVRGRCVLFGGYWWSSNELNDVWEWDGQRWHAFNPNPRPSPTRSAAAAFDAGLAEVAVFGGYHWDKPSNRSIQSNTLWSWNGARWQVQQPGPLQPTPRNLTAIFYDAVVGELIMFGGFVGNNAFSNETWSWRPTQGWRQLATSGSPSPRGWHKVAFDPIRGRAVLFGQYLLWNNEETWEWYGPSRSWTKVSTTPPGGIRREGPDLVWNGKQVLLFGGNGNFGSGGSDRYSALSDLHAWDPSLKAWQQQQGAMPPPTQWVAATDSVRGRLVMVPGDHRTMITWERNSSTWTPQSALGQSLPAQSWSPGLADTYQGSVLLFGGSNYTQGLLDQTWRWDGATWTPLPTGPSPRHQVAMAGTPWNGGKVWMFGGITSDTPRVNSDELWVHGGSNWSAVQKQLLWPPTLANSTLCFDPLRNRLVLFGGQVGGPGTDSNQTWEWDGTRWFLINPLHLPPRMSGHRMVYDPNKKAILTLPWDGESWLYDGQDWRELETCEPFGRRTGAGLGYDPGNGDVVAVCGGAVASLGEWTLVTSNRAQFETFGSGCPAGNREPRLSAQGAPPILGTTFGVDVHAQGLRTASFLIGLSRRSFSGGDLPFDLSPFALSGCWLLVSNELAVPASSLQAGTSARFTLPIPNLASLVGRCLYTQAYVTLATTTGLSDGGILRLGR